MRKQGRVRGKKREVERGIWEIRTQRKLPEERPANRFPGSVGPVEMRTPGRQRAVISQRILTNCPVVGRVARVPAVIHTRDARVGRVSARRRRVSRLPASRGVCV